jgi:hypothetical protein
VQTCKKNGSSCINRDPVQQKYPSFISTQPDTETISPSAIFPRQRLLMLFLFSLYQPLPVPPFLQSFGLMLNFLSSRSRDEERGKGSLGKPSTYNENREEIRGLIFDDCFNNILLKE